MPINNLDVDQQAVIKNPRGARSVIAGPGSGKTTTMVGIINSLLESGVQASDIRAVTFSKEMAQALERRVGIKGVVSTFHSLGYLICSETERKPVEPELRHRLMCKLVRKWGVDYKELDSFIAKMRRENISPEEALDCGEYDYGFAASYAEYERTRHQEGWIDFDSMLRDAVTLLESNLQARSRWQPRYLIVDEGQDTDSCHPPGTLIRKLSPNRWTRHHKAAWQDVPIETLVNGDFVVSWARRHAHLTYTPQPISITARPFKGRLIEVHCGDKIVEMTPDHQVYVTLNGSENQSWVVYLMWREDLGFRIGQCQMRYKRSSRKQRESLPGLGHRFAEERAEKGWILKVCATQEESKVWEQIWSCNFGIPYATYGDKTYNSPFRKRTAAMSAQIFSSTAGRGEDFLQSENLDFNHPLYIRSQNGERKSPSKRYFVTSAINLRPDIMSLPSTTAFQQEKITYITSRQYEGPVYSLNVPKFHTYVANGLVVKNCQWRLMQLMAEKHGNITVVGDPNQCQPKGTKVLVVTVPMSMRQTGVSSPALGGAIKTKHEWRNIEELKVGDHVVAWNIVGQLTQPTGKCITAIHSEKYSGPLLSLTVGDFTTMCTPEHQCWVRFNMGFRDKYLVYLMYRNDLGFRVGITKTTRRTKSQPNTYGLSLRARQENAERAWILRICDTRTEAETFEEICSLQYQIPESVFEPTPCVHKTAETIRSIFSAVSTAGGFACLSAYNLLFDHPIYTKENGTRWRGYFKTAAANILSGFMDIPLVGRNQHGTVHATKKDYVGSIYSLNVQDLHTYIADGLVVGNCIYSFRGAQPENITNFQKWFPGGRRLYLGRNYRSTPQIVAFVRENSPEGTPIELLQRMQAVRTTPGPAISLRMYWSDDAEAESALTLAQKDPLNSVILARTNRTVGLLERLCNRHNVKYHLLGKSGFWKQNEIRRAIDALKEYPTLGTEAALNLVLPSLESKYAVDDRTDKDNDALENLKVFRLIGKDFKMAKEFAVYANKMIHRRNDPRGVSISTVHQAKGGEWKNVYLIGVNAKGFPHPKGEPKEERRIYFVAISRAIDMLRISFAGTPSLYLRRYLTDAVLDRLREKAEEVDRLQEQHKFWA